MNRVLIIDDEVAIVELLSMFLQAEGYDVITAYNGKEGLASVMKCRPDMILCDVMMPVLDGWEMCRHMQSDSRLQAIPIVLMSAVHPLDRQGDCSHAGLLEKPFDLDKVLATVAHFLAKDISAEKKESA
jgi:CheY-like chemotaxis protein